MEHHYESIRCPNCKTVQWAKFDNILPWIDFKHQCDKCKYIVPWDEWERVTPRVLTLYQPWATLLVHKIKLFETRPGATNWTAEKGSYLVHAAGKWTDEQHRIFHTDVLRGKKCAELKNSFGVKKIVLSSFILQSLNMLIITNIACIYGGL